MPVPPAPPIVTLTTDFGLSDHYAGTMKGVILGRCPHAAIVDITHEIPPFSILAGAYSISQAARFFPPETIHVIVIDPGVGTIRKPILVQAAKQLFIAPDNGVLTLIFNQYGPAVTREITNRALWLPSASATFHGRDVFAPVAGALASVKAKLEEIGPILKEPIYIPEIEPKEVEPGVWQGIALSIDHFGNVITNLLPPSRVHFTLEAKQQKINAFHKTFGDAPRGVLFAYKGSSGYLEIAMNQRRAAEALQISVGDEVTLRDTIL